MLVASAAPAEATLAGHNLTSVFDGTGLVARIRVTGVRTLTFDHEGKSYACGTAYSAVVVDRVLGDATGFEFISLEAEPISSELTSLSLDAEYLAFLGKQPEPKPRSSPPSDPLFAKRTQCESSIPYYTFSGYQTVLPIHHGCDGDASGDSVRADGESILEIFGLSSGKKHCLSTVRESIRELLRQLEADRRPH